MRGIEYVVNSDTKNLNTNLAIFLATTAIIQNFHQAKRAFLVVNSCRQFFARSSFRFSARQRSLQYKTSSQERSHFFLHAKGRPQTTQIFDGKSDFFRIFIARFLFLNSSCCSFCRRF
jgi:hypothetical protein